MRVGILFFGTEVRGQYYPLTSGTETSGTEQKNEGKVHDRNKVSGKDRVMDKLMTLLDWHATSPLSQAQEADGLPVDSLKRKRDQMDGQRSDKYNYTIRIPHLKGSQEAKHFIEGLAELHSHLEPHTCWYITCTCGDSTHMVRSLIYKEKRRTAKPLNEA